MPSDDNHRFTQYSITRFSWSTGKNATGATFPRLKEAEMRKNERGVILFYGLRNDGSASEG